MGNGDQTDPMWPEGLSHIRQWALNTGLMPAAQRLTLLAIACHAGEEGTCRISQNGLGNLTGSTRQTISQHIQSLGEAGHLEATPVTTDRGIQYRYLLTGVYRGWVPDPK